MDYNYAQIGDKMKAQDFGRFWKWLFAFTLLAFVFASAWSAVPRLLTVQGRLKQGNILAHGDYNIVFYIYDVSSGGTPLWQETHLNVPVDRGFFSVVLGDSNAINLDFKQQYWLALKVGSDPEMTPRLRLTNSSYAFYAIDANVSAGTSLWTDAGTFIYPNNYSNFVITDSGNVGIGTTSPTNKLDVRDTGNVAMQVFSDTGVANVSVRTYSTSQYDYAGIALNNGTYSPATRLQTFTSAGGNEFRIYHFPNAPITFYTNNAERMRITGSGNVGIGTTNPTTKLEVAGPIKTDTYTFRRVNLTGATSDYTLGVGEEAIINFNDVNSVPLHIAIPQTPPAVYEIYVFITSTSGNNLDFSILPNNISYTDAFTYTEILFYYDGTTQDARVAYNTVTDDFWFDPQGGSSDSAPLTARLIASYYGSDQYKIIEGHSSGRMSGFVGSEVWRDTTTAWTSLGTFKLYTGITGSGWILVKRIM